MHFLLVFFFSEFPFLPELEILSISYMSTLRMIGRGGLGQLSSLKTLYCTNNPYLTYIHPLALSKNGTEDSTRTEWPPIKHVKLFYNGFFWFLLTFISVNIFIVVFEQQ